MKILKWWKQLQDFPAIDEKAEELASRIASAGGSGEQVAKGFVDEQWHRVRLRFSFDPLEGRPLPEWQRPQVAYRLWHQRNRGEYMDFVFDVFQSVYLFEVV